MTALIPLAIKYGIPGATYLIGHLIGFIHAKHAAKAKLKLLAASHPSLPISDAVKILSPEQGKQ
jgi:hypothetical protein